MPAVARKTQLQVIHEISAAFGPGNVDNLGNVFGVIPRGAAIGNIHVAVTTAFNSTTNTLNIGTNAGGGQLMSAVDLKAVARTDAANPSGFSLPGADFPIFATLSSTGAAPTQGAVTVWIEYVPAIG